MCRSFIFSAVLMHFSFCIFGQNIQPETIDSTLTHRGGILEIHGYFDAYYGYNFNRPADNNTPYFVSMSRHNEATINLAYIELKYTTDRLRFALVPGFGTYMNANYTNEPGTLKNIVEAKAGYKLSKLKNIWVDFGIFGSPYTNESAISRDQMMYTRSFAPEYVPYYLAGAKLTIPLAENVNAYVLLLNGWQQINDNNKSKSLGTQIEYKLNDKNQFYWTTYLGDESSQVATHTKTRYYSDLYWIFNPDGKISLTSCAYLGYQQRSDFHSKNTYHRWWQVNATGRYKFSDHISLTGRIEYFDDPDNVQIVPITGIGGFSSYSTGLCLNVKMSDNAMFRTEYRQFFSDSKVYLDTSNKATDRMSWYIMNLTFWF